jgi:MYXO-CTERM domain-containing protein
MAIFSSVQTGCSASTDEVVGEDRSSLSAWGYYGYGGGGYDYGNYDYGNYDYGNYDYGNYDYGNYDYGNYDYGGSGENSGTGDQGASNDPGVRGSSGRAALMAKGCSVGGGAAGASALPVVFLGLALGRRRRR